MLPSYEEIRDELPDEVAEALPGEEIVGDPELTVWDCAYLIRYEHSAPEFTRSDLATFCEYDEATVGRCLNRLSEYGFVEISDEREPYQYQASPELLKPEDVDSAVSTEADAAAHGEDDSNQDGSANDATSQSHNNVASYRTHAVHLLAAALLSTTMVVIPYLLGYVELAVGATVAFFAILSASSVMAIFHFGRQRPFIRTFPQRLRATIHDKWMGMLC